MKSLCKNLIKRTTWYVVAGSRGDEGKEAARNAREIQTVNFLLFSLYEKRDFYSNSCLFFVLFGALLQTAEDF